MDQTSTAHAALATRALPASARSTAEEWDARVDSWATVCAGPAFARFRDRVVAAAQPTTDMDVVDVGCGTGLLTFGLAPRVRRVWAVDVSERMVDATARGAAQLAADNVIACRGDARALPLADASVDLAVSCYTLHHLDDAGKREALREAWRVLRPGGRLIVVDMMFEVSFRRSDRVIIGRKLAQVARKGPAGIVRIVRNGVRLVRGDWEHPAGIDWGGWRAAAMGAGLCHVEASRMEQEAGLLLGSKPG